MSFAEIFTNFDQGSVLDWIFTHVNGELKFLGEFGRCFILRTGMLRNNIISSSSGGLTSNSGNDFLLNFGSSI
jgi:hypothetical protein